MKKHFSISLPWLLGACFGAVIVGKATAQTFNTLYTFTAVSRGTNVDGSQPTGALVASGNTLYGTTGYGGTSQYGTVFAFDIGGTGFAVLRNLTGGSDGGNPVGLVLVSNTLCGTANVGGSFGNGTLFALNTNGTGFTVLDDFSLSVGNSPSAGSLVSSGSTVYGAASAGGLFDVGTIFKANTDGTGFTNVHAFNYRSDGANPNGGLILSGSTLYGTARTGGSFGNGTVFKINVDGTGFNALHHFTMLSNGTNSDGTSPQTGLALSGNTLYGTAAAGGSSGNGAIFSINTDGTSFSTLHNFSAAAISNSIGGPINGDGAAPAGVLVVSGNMLYGTARGGGSSGYGTVFELGADGSSFTTLHSFIGLTAGTNSDGAYPTGVLLLLGNVLYGTASHGGKGLSGTIFSVELPVIQPLLTITSTGANAILTWPTNFTGFTLQSTTNLSSPIWTMNLPAPVLVNGQYTVTNPISGTQQFFRLSQ